MKKRFLSALLCLCMVLGLVPVTVWAATTSGHTHYLCGGDTCNGIDHETETGKTAFATEIKQEGGTLYIDDKEWTVSSGNYALDGGVYYLSGDIKPDAPIRLNGSATLCLNGHSITANHEGDVIAAAYGVTFTLTDCSKGGAGKITHATTNGGGMYVTGTFNMYGGSITGNKTSSRGGGVCVNGGTFNMFGGSITGNTAVYGGGVGVNGGNSSFTMKGGSITGNVVEDKNGNGGGVYVDNNGSFTITGGSISGNTATRNFGGGVYVNSGNFEMSGSAGITGNTADDSGGGVYMNEKTTFNMSGGAICGNTATRNFGGGVCVYINGNFNMSGGEIGDNGARAGGGVFVGDASTFTMTGGSITGNNVSGWRAGGGIYISDSAKKITVSGNIQITGNMKKGTKNENGKYTGGKVENLYLNDGMTITVGGALTNGAKLGVTLAGDYGDNAFTSGWNTYMSSKTPSDYFTSDIDGCEAKLNGSELKLVSKHVHNWTYTAKDNTITATCKNCEDNGGNDYSGGACTVTASDATYNGNVKEAAVSGTGIFKNADIHVSYSKYNATSEQFESTNILPAGAGKYMASITCGDVTAGVEYTIGKANRNDTPDSLTVSPADSVGGKGKINGTTSAADNSDLAMEYNTSADATVGWKDCTSGSTEVAPGTYYVRYKESRNYLASGVSAALTVKAHTHNFIETVDGKYLKSKATCVSEAVYYKSCSCGEKSDETFTSGNKNSDNHIGGTEIRGKADPTCRYDGYEGDTYCLDCGGKIRTGSVIPATNNHADADGKWEYDNQYHWHLCRCGTEFDKVLHSGGQATCNSKAKCKECDQEYGNYNAYVHAHTELRNVKPATEQAKGYSGDYYCIDCDKLLQKGYETDKQAHQLKEVKAKAATVTEEGNTKYYRCDGCGKCFEDKDGKKEISLGETVIKKLPPEIVGGNNSVANRNGKATLSFRSNAAFADFIRVELDGKAVDEKNYIRAEDGTVTLKEDFVSTLSLGEHTLGIVSESGTANAKFTVKANSAATVSPKTGEDVIIAFWCFAAVVSLAVFGAVTVVPKKKRSR